MTFRFLVAEDEEALLGIYKTELSLHFSDSVVDTAVNGQEALELYSKNLAYDLIITDGRMPIMGGVELAGELKSKNYGGPIMLVTGFTDQMHDAKARSLFSLVVEKPLDFDDFLTCVEKLIHRDNQI